MGLGKSLQALVAAVQVKRTMHTRSGFVADVTRAGCALQWVDEIKRHFKQEHYPSWTTRRSQDRHMSSLGLRHRHLLMQLPQAPIGTKKALPLSITVIRQWRLVTLQLKRSAEEM